MRKKETIAWKIFSIPRKLGIKYENMNRKLFFGVLLFSINLLSADFVYGQEGVIRQPVQTSWGSPTLSTWREGYNSIGINKPFSPLNGELYPMLRSDDCEGPIGGVAPVDGGFWVMLTALFGYLVIRLTRAIWLRTKSYESLLLKISTKKQKNIKL